MRKDLTISYKVFLSVLKEWDKYLCVQVRQIQEGVELEPVQDEYGRFDASDVRKPFTQDNKFSEIAELLWTSFEAGADKVDDVHSLQFAERQVEVFRLRYIEYAENWIKYQQREKLAFDRWFRDDLSLSDDPMSTFRKLGQTAQSQIVNSGLLKKATSNYEKIEEIRKELSREHELRENQRREKEFQEEQERKARYPVQREVRLLDKSQCAFCGKKYKHWSFDYYSQSDEFEAQTVFLSCNACLKKIDTEKVEPRFGRFLKEGDSGRF